MPEPIPAALKIDLILAIIAGNVRDISYFSGQYRIEVQPNAVKRWLRRRDRRRAKQAGEGRHHG